MGNLLESFGMGPVRRTAIALVLGVVPGTAWAQAQDTPPLPPASTPLEVLRPAEEAPADDRPEAEEEVSPRPSRPAPSGTSISTEAAREIPGSLGDPARAVDVLPGQSWLVSGLPYAMIRGEPPDNTGYFYDGVRLPLVYHFGIGPAVFPPWLVDRVDFYPASAPARYGRAAGGVVAMMPADEPKETEMRAAARLFDAGGTVRTPFAGGRGTAWIGGRYAWTAALASLFSNQYRAWYGDYHAKVHYDITASDRVGVLALGAYDRLSEESSSGVEPLAITQFHLADLRYDRRFGDHSVVRVAVQVGHDRAGGINDQYATDNTLSARVEATHRLSPAMRLDWGADIRKDSVTTDGSEAVDEDMKSFLVDRTDTTFGAYVSATFRPSDAFEANWGVRADHYESRDADEAAVDPRASLRVRLMPGLYAVGAGAVVHQPPSVIFRLPAVRVSDLPDGLQKTTQTSAGIEAQVAPRWAATLVGFRHWHRNTSDFLGTLTTPNFIPEVLTRTDGATTGGELTLRGRIGPDVGAFLAYTLSRSTRTHEGRTFVSSFDRTHVGTALATYEAGNDWRVGGRLTVVSGVPRSDPAKVGTSDADDRVAPYFRLDGRAEKQIALDGGMALSLYFELINMTANREIILADCEEAGCLKTDKLGPVTVPNVGAEMLF